MTRASKAGVMLPIDMEAIQHQYVSKHATPASLKGYMCHVSFHSPPSFNLHMVGVYNPPMSSANWHDTEG